MRTIRRILTVTSTLLLALGFTNAQADATHPTYNGEVANIINENCVICHREGGIGPMQFTSFEQVRPWAPLIQLRVANRQMPPYAYDHGIGLQDLEGDWRLQQEDIDTIVAWVDQGAPLGDPDITVVTLEFPDPNEWKFAELFGQPSLVVASTPLDIPADGNDLWHQPYNLTNLPTDRCIKAMQVKPRADAAAVVHHANTYNEAPIGDGEFEERGQLNEYAMGKWGEIIPDGVCRLLEAGSRIRWTIHMFPGGVGATAQGEMIEDNVVELGRGKREGTLMAHHLGRSRGVAGWDQRRLRGPVHHQEHAAGQCRGNQAIHVPPV